MPTKLPIDWKKQPLGKEMDVVVAQRLGVSVFTVSKYRRALGIPSFISTHKRVIDWDAEPLGKQTDGSIAENLGVPIAQVRSARTSRGIPPSNMPTTPTGHKLRRRQSDMEQIREELGILRALVEEIHARVRDIEPVRESDFTEVLAIHTPEDQDD